MKHNKSVEFLSIFRMSSLPAQTQIPPHKRKTPLLKTFWWRFWIEYWEFLIRIGRERACFRKVNDYTPFAFVENLLCRGNENLPCFKCHWFTRYLLITIKQVFKVLHKNSKLNTVTDNKTQQFNFLQKFEQ